MPPAAQYPQDSEHRQQLALRVLRTAEAIARAGHAADPHAQAVEHAVAPVVLDRHAEAGLRLALNAAEALRVHVRDELLAEAVRAEAREGAVPQSRGWCPVEVRRVTEELIVLHVEEVLAVHAAQDVALLAQHVLNRLPQRPLRLLQLLDDRLHCRVDVSNRHVCPHSRQRAGVQVAGLGLQGGSQGCSRARAAGLQGWAQGCSMELRPPDL